MTSAAAATATSAPAASATAASAAAAASSVPLETGAKPTVVSVFVGDLDPTVGEDQLLDAFRHSGSVLSVRVCRDIITRKSLGYGYVNFQNHSDAEKAINALNFTPIGARRVRLMWQQRDPALRISGQGNLFVRNLEGTTDHNKLVDLFSAFGHIMSAKVISDPDGKCRGYGFVHFKDESNAAKALQAMNGKLVDGWTNPLYVANFIRRNARIALLVQNFTNVYIKHLLPTASASDIENFFSKFGGITSAITKNDTRGRTFGFCNFKNHEDAVKAIDGLNERDISGLTLEGEKLFVARAQNRAERLIELRQKYLQRQSRGNNLYVRNFDPTFTDENLRELFKGFGEIKSCRAMNDDKGHPRGFGFVSFTTAEEANLALREMNGRMLNGKPLVVNIAQRRDHRLTMLQVQFHQRLQSLVQPIAPMFYSAHKGFLSGPSMPMPMPMPMSVAPPPMMQSPYGPAGGYGMMPGAYGGAMPPMGTSSAAMPASSGGASRTMAGAGPSAAGATAPVGGAKRSKRAPGGGGGGGGAGGRGHSGAAGGASSMLAATSGVPVPASRSAATAAGTSSLLGSASSAAAMPSLALPSLDQLLKMSSDDRKRALGERLFPAVLATDVPEELTPKITGMLLELDPADSLALLHDAKKLKEKIDEALCVLKSSTVE